MKITINKIKPSKAKKVLRVLTPKKKKETYNLKQILQVVSDIYKVESSPDSWNVPVVYESIFKKHLKRRLKHIKQFIK